MIDDKEIKIIAEQIEKDFQVKVSIGLDADRFGHIINIGYVYYKKSKQMFHQISFFVNELENWLEDDYEDKKEEILKKLSIK